MFNITFYPPKMKTKHMLNVKITHITFKKKSQSKSIFIILMRFLSYTAKKNRNHRLQNIRSLWV